MPTAGGRRYSLRTCLSLTLRRKGRWAEDAPGPGREERLDGQLRQRRVQVLAEAIGRHNAK